MKKLLIIAGFALLTITSCKKKEEQTPPPVPPPVEDPAPPPAPEPQVKKTTVVTETTEEKDGTSVSISSDGISVKNKKGENKNNVTISKKKTEVEFKSE